jgi:hypothetical protein
MTTASGSARACSRAASFADHRVFLRRAFADQIADHHRPGGDPDAGLEMGGSDVEPTDGGDHAQPGADGAFSIVLMRPRVAEIDQHAVAHVFRDEAIEPCNNLGHRAVIGGDDLA